MTATGRARGTEATAAAIAADAHEHFVRWLQPGDPRPHRFTDVDLHPVRDLVAATAWTLRSTDDAVRPHVVVAANGRSCDLGTTRPQRLPRFSPDGRWLATLRDPREDGAWQVALHIVADPLRIVAVPRVPGAAESLDWSAAGDAVVAVVAGLDADRAGAAGSGTVGRTGRTTPGEARWRRVVRIDLPTRGLRVLGPDDLNVWEAAAHGDGAVVVATPGRADESAWYAADVRIVADDGTSDVVYAPADQVALQGVSPDGATIALIEGLSSDRGLVAGDLVLIGVADGTVTRVPIPGLDVTGAQWIGADRLGLSGLRGLGSVHAIWDRATGATVELPPAGTSGDRYPALRWRPDGTCVGAFESYDSPPRVETVTAGEAAGTVHLRVAGPGAAHLRAVGGDIEPVSWDAADGTRIEGLLVRPPGPGPHPLVLYLHGGPVWAYRDRWAMGSDHAPLLAAHGFAVLHPNPRGSSGRGAAFVEAVVGDPGGVDARDCLAGVDALVERGIADGRRLGVAGASYGGYLTCLLVTQDDRFGAAVALAPVTDWYTHHHSTNVAWVDEHFVGPPRAEGGLAHERSPLTWVNRVRTPVLLLAGADDRCTTPDQAIAFHEALRANGVPTEVHVYPGEGHGLERVAARIDAATRIVTWFRAHLTD